MLHMPAQGVRRGRERKDKAERGGSRGEREERERERGGKGRRVKPVDEGSRERKESEGKTR
jgi:hypothetical protein